MLSARDRIDAAVLRGLSKLPERVTRLLAGRPVRIDGQELSSQAQLILRLLELTGGGRFEELPVPEARRQSRRDAAVARGRSLAVASVETVEIAGPAGALAARLYVPDAIGSPAPLVVYFHGGGHIVGDLDTHDQPCRFLAREAAALVLAVDYRRGPEHRFPAAVDDSLAAFRHAHAHAADLGADPKRVAVAGDSAGGNLAAVVAQLARADDGPEPAFQALIYPVTDLSTKRRSYELFAEGFFLTEKQMDWYRENYIASADDRSDPRASPLLATDLSGLPPAYVVTAGFDPRRDAGVESARRLAEAGVAVTLRREPDLVHGFINAVGLGGRAQEAGRAVAAALRDGLARRAEALGE
jgi:acetyl esterase